MQSTRQKTEEVLGEAGLSWRDLSGVLLVGGSTKMPMVENWVRQMSGREPLRGINVDEAVCLGAGIQAALEAERQSRRMGLPGTSGPRLSLPGGKSLNIKGRNEPQPWSHCRKQGRRPICQLHNNT